MLKIGVLGAGHLGKIHLRLLQQSEKYELVGFYDENQENGAKIAAEFGYRKLFDSNRQFNLRLYAGSFLYNKTNSDFFSFALDRPTDYLFDYNYFGILTGKILSIDNDYTIIDNQPSFKVRCMLDSQQLYLKNGFKGNLKKGMTLQARFVVARRSLWELLFDKVDDWINPIRA